MAGAAILTRVRPAVIDVELTVEALEAFGTVASVRAHEVFTGGAILAGTRLALVNLHLTVTSAVAVNAMAPVAVSNIFASSVVA